MKTKRFDLKQFIYITLIVSIWINVSEIFRYFLFVMERIKTFFPNKTDVAEMDFIIFSIWGIWDTTLSAIVVFIFWLYANAFGNNNRSVFISSTIVWGSVFVIFWVATANMGLSEWNVLWIILPLSWIEMVIGTWIVSILYKRKSNE